MTRNEILRRVVHVLIGTGAYLVPLIALIESLQLEPRAENRIAGHQEVFWFRDGYVPVVGLHEMFGVKKAEGGAVTSPQPALDVAPSSTPPPDSSVGTQSGRVDAVRSAPASPTRARAGLRVEDDCNPDKIYTDGKKHYRKECF